MDIDTASLCRVNSDSAAVSAALAIKAALASRTRHVGQMNVQPTSISRRHQCITRGSKRVAAGLPSNVPASKRIKKLPHSLKNSVGRNVPSLMDKYTNLQTAVGPQSA